MTNILKRAAFTAAVLVCLAGQVPAQEPASVPDDQVRERLDFIQNALESAKPRARTWWYGWMAAYGAGTAVQWGLSIGHWNDTQPADDSPDAPRVKDQAFAQDMLVGGATTALGFIGLLTDPFLTASGAGGLKSLPDSTPEERRAKLEKAEDLLRRCALREIKGRSWGTHALNLGVNAAAGIVTAAVFKRPWTDGLLTFAVGEAVSLANIFTQPRRAKQAWLKYGDRYLNPTGDIDPESPESRWSLGVFPGGFSLSLAW